MPLLTADEMKAGQYEIVFFVGDYFAAKAVTLPKIHFLDRVPVRFGIADAGASYHVPLLCSPWASRLIAALMRRCDELGASATKPPPYAHVRLAASAVRTNLSARGCGTRVLRCGGRRFQSSRSLAERRVMQKHFCSAASRHRPRRGKYDGPSACQYRRRATPAREWREVTVSSGDCGLKR
jgi:hypothetical protein